MSTRKRSSAKAGRGTLGSVGSRGDSYDNAPAESVIGLFKTVAIRQQSPWRGLGEVEIAVLKWVWWFNHYRLMEPLGYHPPSVFEANCHRRQQNAPLAATLQ